MLANSSATPLHIAVKGRTRLKVPGLFHCDTLKIDLETGFARQPKIRSATTSTLTGNLLVHHDEDLTLYPDGPGQIRQLQTHSIRTIQVGKTDPAPTHRKQDLSGRCPLFRYRTYPGIEGNTLLY